MAPGNWTPSNIHLLLLQRNHYIWINTRHDIMSLSRKLIWCHSRIVFSDCNWKKNPTLCATGHVASIMATTTTTLTTSAGTSLVSHSVRTLNVLCGKCWGHSAGRLRQKILGTRPEMKHADKPETQVKVSLTGRPLRNSSLIFHIAHITRYKTVINML